MILLFQPAGQAAPVHYTEYQTEREHNAFNANRWQLPMGARTEATATVPRISVKGNLMEPSSPRSSANISADGPSRYLLRCSILIRRVGASQSGTAALSRPSGVS
jgi:hypothetical protein